MNKLTCLSLLSLVVGCGAAPPGSPTEAAPAPSASSESISPTETAAPPKHDSGTPSPTPSATATTSPTSVPEAGAPMVDSGSPTPTHEAGALMSDAGSDAPTAEPPCQVEDTKCVECDPNHTCTGGDDMSQDDAMYAQKRYVVLYCERGSGGADPNPHWMTGQSCDLTTGALRVPSCLPIGPAGVVSSTTLGNLTYTLLPASGNMVQCRRGSYFGMCSSNQVGDAVCR